MPCHIALWCAKYHVCTVLNNSKTEIRATICKNVDPIQVFVTTVSTMVGEMVQNSQSLYSFTFNVVIIIHKYIYSRLQDVFIHIQRFIFIHIHDRNIGSTWCNIHSTFSAHHLRASLGPSSRATIFWNEKLSYLHHEHAFIIFLSSNRWFML